MLGESYYAGHLKIQYFKSCLEHKEAVEMSTVGTLVLLKPNYIFGLLIAIHPKNTCYIVRILKTGKCWTIPLESIALVKAPHYKKVGIILDYFQE